MSGPSATKSRPKKGATQPPVRAAAARRPGSMPGLQAQFLALQHSAGNRAINTLGHGSEPEPSPLPLLGGGHPLDPPLRAEMEARFGEDLGSVRVHTNACAADSARAVSAKAYTIGRDVVFAQGKYSPMTPAGKRLLAHELAHVIQQRRGGPLPPCARYASHEMAADRVAHEVGEGAASIKVGGATGVGLACEEDAESQTGPTKEETLRSARGELLKTLTGRTDALKEAKQKAKEAISKASKEIEKLKDLARSKRKENRRERKEAGRAQSGAELRIRQLEQKDTIKAVEAIDSAIQKATRTNDKGLVRQAEQLIGRFDVVTKGTPGARMAPFEPHPAASKEPLTPREAHNIVTSQRGFEWGLTPGKRKEIFSELQSIRDRIKNLEGDLTRASSQSERQKIQAMIADLDRMAEPLASRLSASRVTLKDPDALARRKASLEEELGRATKAARRRKLERQIAKIDRQIQAVREASSVSREARQRRAASAFELRKAGLKEQLGRRLEPTEEKSFRRHLIKEEKPSLAAFQGGSFLGKSRKEAGYNTYVVIQVIRGNEVIATEVARNEGKGGLHAEQVALKLLKKAVERSPDESLFEGAEMRIFGDQVVCPKICTPEVRKFAEDYKLAKATGQVGGFPQLTPMGELAGKTGSPKTVVSKLPDPDKILQLEEALGRAGKPKSGYLEFPEPITIYQSGAKGGSAPTTPAGPVAGAKGQAKTSETRSTLPSEAGTAVAAKEPKPSVKMKATAQKTAPKSKDKPEATTEPPRPAPVSSKPQTKKAKATQVAVQGSPGPSQGRKAPRVPATRRGVTRSKTPAMGPVTVRTPTAAKAKPPIFVGPDIKLEGPFLPPTIAKAPAPPRPAAAKQAPTLKKIARPTAPLPAGRPGAAGERVRPTKAYVGVPKRPPPEAVTGELRPTAAGKAAGAAGVAAVIAQHIEVKEYFKALHHAAGQVVAANQEDLFDRIAGRTHAKLYGAGTVSVPDPPKPKVLRDWLERHAKTWDDLFKFIREARSAGLRKEYNRYMFYLGQDEDGRHHYYDIDDEIKRAAQRIGAAESESSNR